jgi:hypothetical protein
LIPELSDSPKSIINDMRRLIHISPHQESLLLILIKRVGDVLLQPPKFILRKVYHNRTSALASGDPDRTRTGDLFRDREAL